MNSFEQVPIHEMQHQMDAARHDRISREKDDASLPVNTDISNLPDVRERRIHN